MLNFLVLLIGAHLLQAQCAHLDDRLMHPKPLGKAAQGISPKELTANYWNDIGSDSLDDHLIQKINTNVAKNVILFLGDGMSVPTLTATRIYLGNANTKLSFEQFPYTAVSKTYCVDYQVADSACSATAYLGGVKTNLGAIGVTAAVPYDSCKGMTNSSQHVQSIAQWSQLKNKSTGLVTTARVTHASPAGVFGHTAERNWETDTDILDYNEDPTVCTDLATQLVTEEVGKNLNVILGGGRYAFLPKGHKDEQGIEGFRSDGVNLIDTWTQLKENASAEYIWNRDQLLGLDVNETDYVLGLFASSHCPYELERDETQDPSLSEMTKTAIEILSKNPNGYFLFVEGARIDMAHHEGMAHLALGDTVEFARAVELAVNLTSESDTLIVVTSDHAHTMSISGYPTRGNNILGINDESKAKDGLPYTTLNYANGPGYLPNEADGTRHDITKDDLDDVEHRFPGGVPLNSETHGGDDVLIFARGPWAHLYHGVMEQNVIPHIMGYASCVRKEGANACTDYSNNSGSVVGATISIFILIIIHVLM